MTLKISIIKLLLFLLSLHCYSQLNAQNHHKLISFNGLWQYNNGKDSLRIEENGKDYLLQWKSKATNYKPQYITCQFIKNKLIGDYYGHKNNLKIEQKDGFLYLTINPFAEFAPMINQKFELVNTTSKYVLPNEKEIFSFRTFNEKRMSICIDKNNEYIIYRFGTENNIELEYPNDKLNSFDLFRYAYYLRGGGIENEATDENRLFFNNGAFQYIIYDDFYARGESSFYAIKIKNLQNENEFDISVEPSSVKGTLIHLRNYEKLQENELKTESTLTPENLSVFILTKTAFAEKLHFGMKKKDVITYLGRPEEILDEGRNEALGEHFYNMKYTTLQTVIHFNDGLFQSAGKDFIICNIIVYGNSNLKTERGIGIGSSVQEVMKMYKNEIEVGKATYGKNTYGDQNQKHIHLGDTEGLHFTFENDKVVTINLGVFQWN